MSSVFAVSHSSQQQQNNTTRKQNYIITQQIIDLTLLYTSLINSFYHLTKCPMRGRTPVMSGMMLKMPKRKRNPGTGARCLSVTSQGEMMSNACSINSFILINAYNCHSFRNVKSGHLSEIFGTYGTVKKVRSA